ncbi:MAG TPA: hypothetical protein VGU20_16700 [Stellaceae bacterium]|nr:hypothetical protein [Stellaceae bacterium]
MAPSNEEAPRFHALAHIPRRNAIDDFCRAGGIERTIVVAELLANSGRFWIGSDGLVHQRSPSEGSAP